MQPAVLVCATHEFALSPACEANWMSHLPAPRRAALARMPDAAARHRSLLASHLLWRSLQSLGAGADALASFHQPPLAKPTLDLPLDFSLSHGGGMVVCAVSTAGPVGVDVEAITALKATEFGLYLSDEERAWAGNDPARFLSVWTCKEAVVKAAGSDGLAALPRVATRDGGRKALFDGRWWRAQAVALGDAHVARVAWPAELGEVAVRLTMLTREALESHPDRFGSITR